MLRIFLYLIGAFVLFGATGYIVGSRYATNDEIIAIRIANNSAIVLDDKKI